MGKKTTGTVLAIIACLLWSTAFAGIKIGLEYTTPLHFAGMRFTIAGLITLLCSGGFTKHRTTLKKHIPFLLKVAFLQTFMLYLLFYLGLERIDGALGAVITGFTPLWTILLAHNFIENDRITFQKVISFLLGISGVVCVALSPKHLSFKMELAGILCMLGSSLVAAVSAIVVARDRRPIPALPLNGSQLFLGGIFLLFTSYFVEPVAVSPTIEYFSALIYLALLSAIAYSIWFYLIKKGIKISYLNQWKFIIPVMGAVFSWLLIPGEHPSPISILGIVLVGISLLLYYRSQE